MPTRNEGAKEEARRWLCDGCEAGFKYKKDAAECEKRHGWLKAWADGDISDQQYADFMGINVESVKLMTGGSTPEGATPSGRFIGSGGVFIAVTVLHGNGKAQVPHQIRSQLGLKDGDNLFWFKGVNGRFHIGTDLTDTEAVQGRMATRRM